MVYGRLPGLVNEAIMAARHARDTEYQQRTRSEEGRALAEATTLLETAEMWITRAAVVRDREYGPGSTLPAAAVSEFAPLPLEEQQRLAEVLATTRTLLRSMRFEEYEGWMCGKWNSDAEDALRDLLNVPRGPLQR